MPAYEQHEKKTQLIHLECENSCMGLNNVRNKTKPAKRSV